MKNLISKIINGEDIDNIFTYTINNLYQNGAVSTTDMEILSYLRIYQSGKFEEYQNTILNFMALFYKQTKRETLRDVVFGQYNRYIQDTYKDNYTPVQANIVKYIDRSNCFSFSAPTSTGKSFVFMNLIKQCEKDVVVIVPSRSLINEYYLRLCDLITDKSVNILTFIDKINTRFARRNIFVVTPERCRELFKQKGIYNIDLFLFDEAQLSNEDSKRGLLFDSVVRRCQKSFPDAKYVFAHPFVENPESQIKKNHFDFDSSSFMQYTQKNVGQIFVCKNKDDQFSYFGIDTSIMGRGQKHCEYDPISKIIENDGSVLIYISKQKILNGEYLRKFRRYINLCKNIDDPRIELYVEQLKDYTGGDTKINKDYYSSMIAHLRKGIVIHHGSLPLQIRIIIEQFTRDGFCRICFATSTLEQGINMPFDMVYLDRLEGSKPLSVKNLIGRAGRSTQELIFDYGIVGINNSCNISKFRNIINSSEVLDEVSGLEKPDLHDSDYEGFKEAILNDTFSDEYNLTNKEIEIISDEDVDDIIASILNSMFDGITIIKLETVENDMYNRLDLYNGFNSLFSKYLTRNLTDAEANVLNTAVKIIIWKIYGKTFKKICWYRYAYASNTRARRVNKNVSAKFITGYADIPNKSLSVFGLFPLGTKAKDVDYDTIMYDTYDYIDKLIGFKLCDVFYAAFYKYYEKTGDIRSLRLAKYIKYGTDNDRHIWMLRYGLDFEDIDLFDPHIDTITSEQITFKNSIFDLSKDELNPVYRFLQ